MGSEVSLNRMAVRQGLNDHLTRLRERHRTVDNLIRVLEAYDREQATMRGPKTPGYRLR